MGEHKHHRRKSTCIGFDAYNQVETGDISKSLNASATDSDHIPCVYAVDQGAGKSGCNVTEETAPTLACTHGGEPVVFDGSRRHDYKEFGDVSETVQAQYGTGGNNTPIVIEQNMGIDGYNQTTFEDVVPTLMCQRVDTKNIPSIVENLTFSDVAACRSADDGDKGVHSQMMVNPEENFVLMNKHDDVHVTYQETAGTGGNTTCISKGTSNEIANNDMLVANTSIVRRLTPKECERLQAFPDDWTLLPDGWTDTKGKFHKPTDSNRYKALGNSIALCWWEWMAERMMDVFNEEIGEEATMASLFDGIGGFPLVYSRHGCRPVWASEIEEFPIAVTKARFPEV